MRRSPRIEPLRVVQAAQVEAGQSFQWLVEGLWSEQGVGFIGGLPKSGKTWLALDLALSIASGTPALDHYSVLSPGPVLLFAAEDPPHMIRCRLEGLAQLRNVKLHRVPLHLILTDRLRLDTPTDQTRLAQTLARYRPKLLLLDPFIRVHQADENSALEVSRLLAYLRQLQRRLQLAIVVVHHARKAQAGNHQFGLGLRGSGDFHAWGDDLLYLRQRRGALEMLIEHRAASAPQPVQLTLQKDEATPPHLAVVSTAPKGSSVADLKARIMERLSQDSDPRTQEELRVELRVRMQRLVMALRELVQERRVQRTMTGWILIR